MCTRWEDRSQIIERRTGGQYPGHGALIASVVSPAEMSRGYAVRELGDCHHVCLPSVPAGTERGGPPVVAPTAPAGFGSKMVKRGMSSQLGGSIAFDWSKQGVIVTLRMNRDRLAT